LLVCESCHSVNTPSPPLQRAREAKVCGKDKHAAALLDARGINFETFHFNEIGTITKPEAPQQQPSAFE
jgi:hypothetical protein